MNNYRYQLSRGVYPQAEFDARLRQYERDQEELDWAYEHEREMSEEELRDNNPGA